MVEQQNYLLEWIDILISVTLNPEKTEIDTIHEDQLEYIANKLNVERDQFMRSIMSHVFSGNDIDLIKTMICQYHDTLIILLDQALTNQKLISHKKNQPNQLFNSVITFLEELLSFMESRFSNYLSLSDRAPSTYAAIAGKELESHTKKLKAYLKGHHISDTFKIVLKRIDHFATTICRHKRVSFNEVLYQKELLRGLEEIIPQGISGETFSPLDKLLIYLNFNSKAYINELTNRLAKLVNRNSITSEKMSDLLIYFKAFNQLHKKPDVILNINYHDLSTLIENWFTQEILYLEKKLHLSVVPLQSKKENPANKQSTTKEKQKVLCMLSTDQMGLILRASDELRILVAKSMSQVFKTIVPHLSTPYKEDLSYDGMRSKSYVAEERDKQIAIETLERIIKKIKEY